MGIRCESLPQNSNQVANFLRKLKGVFLTGIPQYRKGLMNPVHF